MASPLAWAAQILLVAILTAALTYAIRRPILRAEPTLRGGTRLGKLYVVVTNRGGIAALRVSARVEWVGEDGARALVESRLLGTLDARDAIRLEVTGLHHAIDARPGGWRALEVRITAANALGAAASLPIATRAREDDAPAPVRYVARNAPCPAAADGAHAFVERRILNDGVSELWRLCARCRHVVREPLTDAEKARQAHVRRERAERERQKVEEEWARREAEEAEQAPRTRPRTANATWRNARQQEPARDEDRLPPDVAFYILDLDPATATWQDVAVAHRRLTLANHPDKRHDLAPDARRAAEQKMQEINAARDRLREHFGLRAPLE